MHASIDWRRVACAAAVVASLAVGGCKKPAPPEEDIRPVNVVKVSSAAGDGDATYTGDVRARYEAAMGFRVPGKVVARSVEVGTRVEKGQILARLDPGDFQLNIEAQRSQLAAAESDFLQAKDDLERYRNLFEQKFVSAAEFDRRQNLFNVAKARLEQARAQLGVSQNQSDYTTLRADARGVITSITAEVGQVVAAGQEVMRLARMEEKEVVVSVPESRLDEIRAAKDITVSLWAEPNEKFSGRIREISPSADPVTRTYAAKITIVNPSQRVQLGMTANVRLDSVGPQEVIRLPLSALYQQDKSPAVWVVDAKTGKVALTPVKVGRYTQEAVEVLEGLKAGDVVVRAGVHKLTPGQQVRIIAPGA